MDWLNEVKLTASLARCDSNCGLVLMLNMCHGILYGIIPLNHQVSPSVNRAGRCPFTLNSQRVSGHVHVFLFLYVLHMWKSNNGRCLDLILQILPRVQMRKQLMRPRLWMTFLLLSQTVYNREASTVIVMLIICYIQGHLEFCCMWFCEWQRRYSIWNLLICDVRKYFPTVNEMTARKWTMLTQHKATSTGTFAYKCIQHMDTHINTLGFSRKLWLLATCHCPPAGPRILTGSLFFLHTQV